MRSVALAGILALAASASFAQTGATPQPVPAQPAPSPVPEQAAPAPSAGQAAPAAPVTKAAAGDHPGAVKSPMVGTVYLQPDENSPPYVKAGDTVSEGQTLLLVEAMKTFNPVTAPRAGKVTQILVKNTQPVEFGEPLVIIE